MSGTSSKYAAGTEAWGLCQYCGLRYFLRELVFDGYYPNLRVCKACYTPKQPQEFLIDVTDPVALYRPSPEWGPKESYLSGAASVGFNTLNWTECIPRGGSRVNSYALWRSASSDGQTWSAPGLIANLPLTYWADPPQTINEVNIGSLANLVDNGNPIFNNMGIEDQTLDYEDDGVVSDVYYQYEIIANLASGRQAGSNKVILQANLMPITLSVTAEQNTIDGVLYSINVLAWNDIGPPAAFWQIWLVFNGGDPVLLGTYEEPASGYHDAYPADSMAPGMYTYYVVALAADSTPIETSNSAAVTWAQVETPTFDPAAGSYDETQNVVIATGTPDATIYYTTDGSTPTRLSTEYTGAIAVSSSQTLNALAVAALMTDSDIGTAAYTIAVTLVLQAIVQSSPGADNANTLIWNDIGGTVDHYLVYSQINGGGFNLIATVYEPTVTYADEGPADAWTFGEYDYYVEAYDDTDTLLATSNTESTTWIPAGITFTIDSAFYSDLPNCVAGGEDFSGYGYSASPLDPGGGTPDPNPTLFANIQVIGCFEIAGNSINGAHAGFVLALNGPLPQNIFISVSCQLQDGSVQTFDSSDAAFAAYGGTANLPLVDGDTWVLDGTAGYTIWGWDVGIAQSHVNFDTDEITTVTITTP